MSKEGSVAEKQKQEGEESGVVVHIATPGGETITEETDSATARSKEGALGHRPSDLRSGMGGPSRRMSRQVTGPTLGISSSSLDKRASIASSSMGSGTGWALKRPVTRLAPTFQLEPKHGFEPKRVEMLLAESLSRRLANFTYAPRLAALTCKSLAEEFKNKVKEFGYERYKVVALVSLSEKREQAVSLVSRCVWDPRFDSFAQFTHSTPQFTCTALIFGVYRE